MDSNLLVLNSSKPPVEFSYMDYYIDFSHPIPSWFLKSFDENLEAEYILRTRTIFDEFVCPESGTFLMCPFSDLLNGINRLWSLVQEMNEKADRIHDRVIHLPLLFMIILLNLFEQEYTQEDMEKSLADPSLAEVLSNLFIDFNVKMNHFSGSTVQIIIFNTLVLYTRHCLKLVSTSKSSADKFKWNELRVESCRITCPFRPKDLESVKKSLLHFKSNILPQFSKRNVKYNIKFKIKIPEVMEPTREFQIEVAGFLNTFSILTMITAIILFIITLILSGGDGSSNPPQSAIFLND